MTIRTARPEDTAELLKIYEYYVKNTAITFEYEVPSLQEFRSRIENTLKKYPYLIAEADGKIAGYAYASAFHPRAAYQWDAEASIYLRNDMHRMGLGRKLYERLEEILKKMNIINLYACIAYTQHQDDPYLTNNSPHFHEHMGFEKAGHFHNSGYKFGRWYDMTFMEKKLSKTPEKVKAVIPFPELKDF
ncbi:MAG: N-acetyltransferase [Treponema sp.]|nr:N-acetyltransferase [Treponema sp.]